MSTLEATGGGGSRRRLSPAAKIVRFSLAEIAPVDIEILSSATYFARGDLLRLDGGRPGGWREWAPT